VEESTLTTYDLGAGVNLRYFVYDRDGILTDASVSLGIARPDGTDDPVTVLHTSTGQYDANTYTPPTTGFYAYKWTVSGAVTDVATGSFLVADPAPSVYCSLAQVKAQLSKDTDDERDDLIEVAIRSASRKIDQITGRRFYADSAASARVFGTAGRTFAAPFGTGLHVDDIASATGLLVSGGSYGSYTSPLSTFYPGPDNALAYGKPITYLMADPGFYSGVNSVQITARWGWPVVPDEVEEACILLAARLYRRKDSPQGVISSADWGSVRVSRVDPDVEALISHLILPGFA
jgi:hypothetical protein